MATPYLIQPDYTNAMVKGLSTNLAYMAESKKGSGKTMRGRGGKGKPSGPEQAVIDRKLAEAARMKENKERNLMYQERQAAEEKENLLAEKEQAESKRAGSKEAREKKKAFMDQWKSYAGSVTQENYDDYLLFGKENGVEVPGAATIEQARSMEPAAFKEYMGGFFGGKTKKAASEDKYSKSQKIDDTRGHYSFLTRSLLDEDGFVKEGMEDQYKNLTDQYEGDVKKIGKGEEPTWLVEEQQGIEAVPPGQEPYQMPEEAPELPPPSEHKGRVIVLENGKRFFSTGISWDEIQ